MKADFDKQLEEANNTLKEAQNKISSFDETVSSLTQKQKLLRTSF